MFRFSWEDNHGDDITCVCEALQKFLLRTAWWLHFLSVLQVPNKEMNYISITTDVFNIWGKIQWMCFKSVLVTIFLYKRHAHLMQKLTYSDSVSCIATARSSVLPSLRDQSVWFQKIILKNPNPASAILRKIVTVVLFILKSIIIQKVCVY